MGWTTKEICPFPCRKGIEFDSHLIGLHDSLGARQSALIPNLDRFSRFCMALGRDQRRDRDTDRQTDRQTKTHMYHKRTHQEMRKSERELFYDSIAHVLQNTKKENLLRLTN